MDSGHQIEIPAELVAEREKLHAALEEVHRLQTVFRSVSSGITISDANQPDQPLTYVSPAFERITGYTTEEVLGRNCRFLQGPDTDQPGVGEVRAAIREARQVRVVLRNYRKDGSRFWNELYLSPIFDLEGRLTHFVGVQNDVTAQIEAERRLEYMAHHDELTGLYNRGQLMLRLKQALSAARRRGRPAAVLFFDLTNFKQVNDMLGHEAGDRLLKTVADRMRAVVREDDTLARLGGDEFVVVLHDPVSASHAMLAMRRLEKALAGRIDLLGEPVYPSASVGMALSPQDGETPDELLRVADMRMYLAKHAARSAAQEQEDEIVPLPATKRSHP